MDKRRSKRKPVNLKMQLIIDDMTYPVFIENISEYGMQILATSKMSITSFIPDSIINLILEPLMGKKINLLCEVKWVSINETPFYGLTYKMGVQIKQNSLLKKYKNSLVRGVRAIFLS